MHENENLVETIFPVIFGRSEQILNIKKPGADGPNPLY